MSVGRVKRAGLTLALLGLAVVLAAWAIPAVRTPVWELRSWAIGGDFLGWEGTVRQQGRWDCGVAAAAMVLRDFQGDTAHLAAAHEEALRGARALTMLEVRSLLARGGVQASGVRTDFATLRSLPMPAVAHIPEHFLVVDSIRPGSVFVRDPARGRMRLTDEAFGALWTGNALVVTVGTPRP